MDNLQAEKLYDNTCIACSALITKRYSTSFSAGISTLDKKLHNSIYAIYGFVRFADEIVDTFHQYDKEKMLESFMNETYLAIEEKVSFNPVLHAFQQVVRRYNIDAALIKAFFCSMQMDLKMTSFDETEYKKYIYGSAEVVGLMCLFVFLSGDQEKYLVLEPYAKSLGAAFQKVNFLRDIKSDFHDRDRVYFPNVDINHFTNKEKKEIENDIQKDFDHAAIGIEKLPKSSKKGVYLAYIYFNTLLKEIKKVDAHQILEKRIRVSNFKKSVLFFKTLVSK